MHCNRDEFTASPLVKVGRAAGYAASSRKQPPSSSGTPSVPAFPLVVREANSSGATPSSQAGLRPPDPHGAHGRLPQAGAAGPTGRERTGHGTSVPSPCRGAAGRQSLVSVLSSRAPRSAGELGGGLRPLILLAGICAGCHLGWGHDL